MNFQYVEVQLKLEEALSFFKDKKDCLVTVELESDSTVKCYTYPANAEGFNVITSLLFYYNDYAECSNDEEYKNWLQTCFAQELIIQKDGTEYEVKIKLI